MTVHDRYRFAVPTKAGTKRWWFIIGLVAVCAVVGVGSAYVARPRTPQASMPSEGVVAVCDAALGAQTDVQEFVGYQAAQSDSLRVVSGHPYVVSGQISVPGPLSPWWLNGMYLDLPQRASVMTKDVARYAIHGPLLKAVSTAVKAIELPLRSDSPFLPTQRAVLSSLLTVCQSYGWRSG
jgi:hypothetical protein